MYSYPFAGAPAYAQPASLNTSFAYPQPVAGATPMPLAVATPAPMAMAAPAYAAPMAMPAPVAVAAPAFASSVVANAPPMQQTIVMEKIVMVDAPVPPPVVQTQVVKVPQPPKVLMQEKIVTIPAPPAQVIQVPKVIEHHPQIIENTVYVQKPPIAPQVITQQVQELLPQETVFQEVVKNVQAPPNPPIYQEVVQHVQVAPPAWAVPNKVVPTGPVLKTDSHVLAPGGVGPGLAPGLAPGLPGYHWP